MPLNELGALIHENRGCATCHSLDGTRGQGPSWKGIWGQTHKFQDGSSAVVDENYIRQSIMEPQAHIVQGYEGIMPTYQGLLRPREILGVIEFIKTFEVGHASYNVRNFTMEAVHTHHAAGENYLNTPKGLKSWLTTVDHKRIGIMYLGFVLAFFFIAGIIGAGGSHRDAVAEADHHDGGGL